METRKKTLKLNIEEHIPSEWCEFESEVAQSCLTLSDPMDCSPPGFSRQKYWSG